MLQTSRIHAPVAGPPARTAHVEPRIQRITERVGLWWTRIVLVAALLTIAIWSFADQATGLKAGLAVLFAGSPCALYFATPIAMRIAKRKARDAGVDHEDLFTLDTVFVDKTALTIGHPEVVNVITRGITENELLRIAAAAEHDSENHIAHAIRNAARARELSLPRATAFVETVHRGITARVHEREIAIGNFPLMDSLGVDVGLLQGAAEAMRHTGKIVVYVAIDREIAGIIAVSDAIKGSMPGALGDLGKAGVHVALVSADSFRTAQAVADEVGIIEVHAEVTPDEKREIFERARRENRIAVVADQTIDVRALAHGARIVTEAMRDIRENIWLAIVPAAIGVPLAALTIIGPIAGAAIAIAACVAVVANGLRLRRVLHVRT